MLRTAEIMVPMIQKFYQEREMRSIKNMQEEEKQRRLDLLLPLIMQSFGMRAMQSQYHSDSTPVPRPNKRKREDDCKISTKRLRTGDPLSCQDELDEINPKSTHDKCVICLEAPINHAFVHYGTAHYCACAYCAWRIKTGTKRCPLCNFVAEQVIKIY